jgi:hypothetical protein
MAKTKKKPSANRAQNKMDGVYLLKLTLYVILGSMWIKITRHNTLNIPIPVGFIAGLLFASHEHFQIDRKIEYAVLMVAMLVGYFAPYGLYLNF